MRLRCPYPDPRPKTVSISLHWSSPRTGRRTDVAERLVKLIKPCGQERPPKLCSVTATLPPDADELQCSNLSRRQGCRVQHRARSVKSRARSDRGSVLKCAQSGPVGDLGPDSNAPSVPRRGGSLSTAFASRCRPMSGKVLICSPLWFCEPIGFLSRVCSIRALIVLGLVSIDVWPHAATSSRARNPPNFRCRHPPNSNW